MDIISTALASKANKRITQLIGDSRIEIPTGTTAERPTLGVDDRAIRYNTDENGLEEWNGIEWKNVSASISAVNLKGADTEANILAMAGMVAEDLWIASDTLDGWVYDGSTWINLGPLQGPQGIQGIQGPTGNGIASIVRTTGDGSVGTVDTYTITYSDATTSTFEITNGSIARSVDTIARTSGDGSQGTTDTYTVTYTDASTSTFDVYNGADGDTIDHVSRTAGDGSSGTTDTYTVWGDVGETQNLGTFDVYNGANGSGTVASVVAGTGVSVDNTDPANPVISVTGLVGSIDDLSDVDTTTSAPTDGQVLKWDNTGGNWVPGDASVVGNIDDLNDVDTSTVGPENGQALVWDGTSWIPGTVESGNIAYTKTTFTATEGQTEFSVAYSVEQVEVYRNGFLLDISDYVATNGTSITLNAAATLGDVVTVVAFNTVNLVDMESVSITNVEFVATEGQTVFPVEYTSGKVEVLVEGLQLLSSEYDSISGTEIVLNVGVSAGTNVVVRTYAVFNMTDTYTKSEVDAVLETKQDTGINPVVASIIFGG
jgi:hypothetical protein